MRIGIIGGTGAMGKGFALRWCKNNQIMIGSRDAGRASAAAAEYSKAASEYGLTGDITGGDNASVAQKSDVVVLSIPYGNIDTVCPEVLSKTRDGCVIVSPIVPMEKTERGFEFIPLRDAKPSSHELVSKHMKNPAMLVSAFHVISEKKLANPKTRLDCDIFVCGDDAGAVGVVDSLIRDIEGLRPVHIGGSTLAYMAEIATPLLLNAMIRNKLKNPGIKLV